MGLKNNNSPYMPDNSTDTEEQIFQAACRVFQRKGYAGARMQEIADEADINKSMLHYYYRSKDKLFKQVYQRQMERFFPVIFKVLESEKPLDRKIEELIDVYYSFLRRNPKIAQFLVHEMNQNPVRYREFIEEKEIHPPEAFFRQVEREIEAGHLNEVDPKQLLTSIVGLVLFPFLAQTMIEGVFGLDDEGFSEYLSSRKEFLRDFILNGINYSRQ